MSTDDAELERLRILLGPSEIGYARLLADVEAASDETRAAMLDAGRLRGELAEMSVQLARARQDQDTMQRRRNMGPIAHLDDLAREYWSDVLRPRVGRLARSLRVRRSR